MTFYVAIACVTFARYCGKSITAIFFRTIDCNFVNSDEIVSLKSVKIHYAIAKLSGFRKTKTVIY